MIPSSSSLNTSIQIINVCWDCTKYIAKIRSLLIPCRYIFEFCQCLLFRKGRKDWSRKLVSTLSRVFKTDSVCTFSSWRRFCFSRSVGFCSCLKRSTFPRIPVVLPFIFCHQSTTCMFLMLRTVLLWDESCVEEYPALYHLAASALPFFLHFFNWNRKIFISDSAGLQHPLLESFIIISPLFSVHS